MELTDETLALMEKRAVASESWEAQLLGKAVFEIRRLRHELEDPNYLYAGRIPRQAILCRDAEIDALRKQVKELKEKQCSPESSSKAATSP